MKLNAEIWGPKYWFVLHTIARCYPKHPTSVTKKKFYDFIQNIPLFIPDEKLGNKFSNLLDKFPVTPYLDSKDSFIRWCHFIHNRVNEFLKKPVLNYSSAVSNYLSKYKPKKQINYALIQLKKNCIFITFVFILITLIFYLYNK